jgi:hypothetical protein
MWRPLIGGRSADWEAHFGSVDRGQQTIWAVVFRSDSAGEVFFLCWCIGKGHCTAVGHRRLVEDDASVAEVRWRAVKGEEATKSSVVGIFKGKGGGLGGIW